jgi:hypothetical protein
MPSVITPCGGGSGGALASTLVTHSVDQSIANNTLAALAFNTTIFDDDGMHSDTVNNSRLTCRVAGRYLLTANTAWVQNNTGFRVTEFLLNGGGFFGGMSAPATVSAGAVESSRQSFSAFVQMVVGDYVECAVKQGSGGSLAIFSFLIPTGITPTFGALRMG